MAGDRAPMGRGGRGRWGAEGGRGRGEGGRGGRGGGRGDGGRGERLDKPVHVTAMQGPYWQPCQCARQAQAAVVSRSGSLAEANVGWDTTGWLLNSLCVRDDKVAMVDGDKAACQAQPAPVHPG
jgi:hypothetical protein